MGAIVSLTPSSSTSPPAAASSDSIPRTPFKFPCEFIIEPEGEVPDKQPTSDDAVVVAMDVISLNIAPPNPSSVVDLCDHVLGQSSLRAPVTVKYTEISKTPAAQTTTPSDRPHSKPVVLGQATKASVTRVSLATRRAIEAAASRNQARRLSTPPIPSSFHIATLAAGTPKSAPSSPLKLPDWEMASLSNLTLHSPSSQIIGTPFATNSSPYEYPFPQAGDGESSSESPSGSTRPPSPPASPFPVFAAPSTLLSDPATTLALSMSMPPELSGLPPPPPIQNRMRMTPLPIPPSLMNRQINRVAGRRGSNENGRQDSLPDSDAVLKNRPPQSRSDSDDSS